MVVRHMSSKWDARYCYEDKRGSRTEWWYYTDYSDWSLWDWSFVDYQLYINFVYLYMEYCFEFIRFVSSCSIVYSWTWIRQGSPVKVSIKFTFFQYLEERQKGLSKGFYFIGLSLSLCSFYWYRSWFKVY